jgi:hypothetical protein
MKKRKNQHPLHPLTANQKIKNQKHSLILNIDHPLRMCITEITLMWGTRVDLGLVERVGDFIGEDARGEA